VTSVLVRNIETQRPRPGTHDLRIAKSSEANWNDRVRDYSYLTFSGFLVDPVAVGTPAVTARGARLPRRRLEFLGDSITAGYCNTCHGTGASDNDNTLVHDRAESFVFSWPSQMCNALAAQCHTVAWSGLGMVANCCGFSTQEEPTAAGGRGGRNHLMPEIFGRTLASDGDTNWDWSTWVPDALVVNLGTNDGGAVATPQYATAYTNLVLEAFQHYGPQLHVFLACGPMTDAYCGPIAAVINTVNAAQSSLVTTPHVHFLDQRGFLDGSHGAACCGHPSVQVDTAMAARAVPVLEAALGWQ
jgi:lysophospholipase L1-like esterase